MLDWARSRLTYANVVATVALFGVLAGGVAVGATVKKDSVGKKQLKDQAVIGKKIADATIKSGKLGDGSVTTPKLADEAVTGPKVDESSLGAVPQASRPSTPRPWAARRLRASARRPPRRVRARTCRSARRPRRSSPGPSMCRRAAPP